MIIVNDFYSTMSGMDAIQLIGFSFAGGCLFYMIFAAIEQWWASFVSFFFVAVILASAGVYATAEINDARASVERAVESYGVEIIDGFPESEGSDFLVEKDGEIQQCLVMPTFEGGNTVRIECRG